MAARHAVATLLLLALSLSFLTLTAHPARSQSISSACRAAARIDEVGDLTLYAVYNVTSVPSLLVVPARSPVSYFAVENGTTPLPVQYNGTDLLVAVDQPGLVNVSYLTFQATSKEGALWEANFTVPCAGDVTLPRYSTPVYVSPIPQQVFYVNGSPVLVMPSGPLTVEYMISPPTTTPITTISSTSTTTSPTTTTSVKPTPLTSYFIPIVMAIVVVGAVAGAAAAVLRRRGGAGPVEALDDRDRAILSAISRLGGEATASQVMNETNIPKSPLYRRLDKLVRLGYLEEVMKGNTKVYRCKRGCS